MTRVIDAVMFLAALSGTVFLGSLFGVKVFDDWVRGEFPYPPFGDEFRRKYGKDPQPSNGLIDE